MPVKISAVVPQKVYLEETDLSGETYVEIRPPTYREHAEREGFLSANRRVSLANSGEVQIGNNANFAQLAALEVWLTYQSTNLTVQFVDDEGKVVDEVSFKPREKMTREEFFEALYKLPASIVEEWHRAVLQVVPDWSIPF